jgi:8-oxo-dGTP diphosphatase
MTANPRTKSRSMSNPRTVVVTDADQYRLYVMGLATKTRARVRSPAVVLILKDHGPDYVVGKWNGVGGKVEDGETIEQAMAREFAEETGVQALPESWRWFCDLEGDGYQVSCLVTQLPQDANPQTMEKETVSVWPLDTLPETVVPNVRWLIPMALDMTETGHGVEAVVRDAQKRRGETQ